ncbi:MAG TPA: hypothetical protein VF039_13490 [Longimicrobiales bacterium]
MRFNPMLALLFALPACRGDETRTFELSQMEPDAAMELVEPYVPGGTSDMRVVRNGSRATLTVTAPGLRLAQIEELLAEYDRNTNVELRFQIIEADGFTGSDPAIADVEQALRELFRFDGYRLASEVMVQATAPGDVDQYAAGNDGQEYRINASLDRLIQSDSAAAVGLSVSLRSGGGTLLYTSLTVPSGKTVVVGSARARESNNTVILVVRPVIR